MVNYSALILILLAVGFLLRIDFVFYVIYVCVGVFIWSRWYTPRALAGILASREFVDHAFWGETVTVKLRLANRKWLPVPWLHFTESVAVQLAIGDRVNQVVSMATKETIEFCYDVSARRRGYYRLGPLKLRTGDLFGLGRDQQGELRAGYLTVYPRIVPLSELGVAARMPFGTIPSRQKLFADPSRSNGVREFRSGDSLRHINWKVSAHTRQIMVRTLEPAISLETSLLLNLHAGDYQRQNRASTIEWAIEVAASLAALLINQRQAVGMMSNGFDPLAGLGDKGAVFDESSGRVLMQTAEIPVLLPSIPARPGRDHLMKLLEQLARIEGGESVPFVQWAPGACLHLAWGVTILAINANGDEAICQTLHRLVRTGYNPVLIAVEPDHNFGIVRERARRLGFAALNITTRDDLIRWARSKRPFQR